MKAIVSDKNLLLEYDNVMERKQLHLSFTKKIRNWRFRTKGKSWNGDVLFLSANGSRMSFGLWQNLYNVCNRYGLNLEIIGLEAIVNEDFTREYVESFCYKLFEKDILKPRPYQIDTVHMFLKYKFAMADLAPRAGKTMIAYMYIMLLKFSKKLGRILIICPDADLVIQFYNDFLNYAKTQNIQLNICQVHGGSSLKDIKQYDIIVGSFLTLGNRNSEFFDGITRILCDEVHRAESKTIKDVIAKNSNVTSRVGFTGSLITDDSAEYFSLIENFGPVVKIVTKKDLMDAGFATPMIIKVIKLSWVSKDIRKNLARLNLNKNREEYNVDGIGLYELERQTIRDSDERLDWVCRFISSIQKNTLVYFSDKKYKYGKRIVEKLKLISSKEIYYVDGDISTENRKTIISRMEESNNCVLVASFQTFSTGKTIRNLHNIVTAESIKSEVILDQATGRGMTLGDNKDSFVWYDIADDLS
jgi:superfamily II DNA or RNA helicase